MPSAVTEPATRYPAVMALGGAVTAWHPRHRRLAARRLPTSPGELSQDALVEALVPDPGSLADVVMLHGYLGKSAVEGSWRLYLTPDLDEYVEIPEDKILHHRRLSRTGASAPVRPRSRPVTFTLNSP